MATLIPEISHLDTQAVGRGQRVGQESFEISKPIHSENSLRSNLIILPKQFQQLRPRHSNTRT